MLYSGTSSALAFCFLLLRTSIWLRGFSRLTVSAVMLPFAALAQPSLPAPAPHQAAQVQTVDVSLRLGPNSSVDSLRAAATAQARVRAMESVPNASLLASHLKADDHSEAVTAVWAALVRPALVSVSVRQADGEQWADFRFSVSIDTSEVRRQVQHLQTSGALQHLAYVQGARANAAAQALVSGADLTLSSGSQLVDQLRGLLDALRASSAWEIEPPEVKSEREQALAQWRLQQPVRRSSALSLGTPWSMDELRRMPPPALLSASERLVWEFLVTKALADQLRNAGPRTNTTVTPSGLVFPSGRLLDLALLQDPGSVFLEAMELNVFDQLLRSRVDVRLLNTRRLADGRVHVDLAVRVRPPSARAVTTPGSLLFAVPELRATPEPGRGLRAFADAPRHCGRVDKQFHGSLWQTLQDRAVTLTLTVGKGQTQLHLAGMNSSGLFCVYLPAEFDGREAWRTVGVSMSSSEAEAAGSVVATISRR